MFFNFCPENSFRRVIMRFGDAQVLPIFMTKWHVFEKLNFPVFMRVLS
jgi:hypothetical protein